MTSGTLCPSFPFQKRSKKMFSEHFEPKHGSSPLAPWKRSLNQWSCWSSVWTSQRPVFPFPASKRPVPALWETVGLMGVTSFFFFLEEFSKWNKFLEWFYGDIPGKLRLLLNTKKSCNCLLAKWIWHISDTFFIVWAEQSEDLVFFSTSANEPEPLGQVT